MNETVEVSRDVFEPIALLVREGLFKNEKDALKCLVLDQAASKMRQFDFKISEMCAKHKMSFDDFKGALNQGLGKSPLRSGTTS